MQPSQQASTPPVRNLIIFVLLSVAVIAGWQVASEWLWPTPPKPTKIAANDPNLTKPSELTAEQKQYAGVARFAAVVGLGTPLEAIGPTLVAPPLPPLKAPEPPPTVTPLPPALELKTDTSYLQVTFNPRDGSISKVVLPQFDQASAMGLPDKNSNDGTVRPLQLVGHTGQPSFQLLHYEQYSKPNPSDRLGRQTWTSRKLPDQDGKGEGAEFKTVLQDEGIELTKTYRLRPGDYHVSLEVNVKRLQGSTRTEPFRYQLSAGTGTPIEGVWYTSTYRNAITGWVDSGNRPRRSFEDAASIHYKAGGEKVFPAGQGITFAGVAVQYFASVVAVDDEQEKRNFLEYTRATAETPASDDPMVADFIANKRDTAEKSMLGDVTVRVVTEPLKLAPNETVTHKYLLYNGPAKVRLLRQMDASTGYPDGKVDPALVDRYEQKLHLDTITDYHWPNFFGYVANAIYLTDITIFFTNTTHSMIWALRQMTWLPYSLCIVALTIIVRLLLLPFSYRQAKAGLKLQQQMAALQPEFEELQRKYPGPENFQALQQAKTELMLRKGINPLNQLGGCLLVFAQLPILSGLFYALSESIFFRLRPLVSANFWMPNLAAPDMLFWWGQHIPFLSDPTNLGSMFYLGPFFNLLPIISLVIMFVQQQMYMPPATDDVQKQQQTMFKFMMGFMTIMFFKMAAGVCIYYIVSSLWGFAERAMLPKARPNPDGSTPGPKPGPAGVTANGPPPSTDGRAKVPTPQDAKSYSKKAKKQRQQQKAKEAETAKAESETLLGKFKAWLERVLEEAKKK